MILNRVFLIAFCVVFISGCSTISSKKVQYSRNYTVNVEKRVNVKNTMIAFEEIKYIRGRRLAGVPQSMNYWQSVEYPSEGSFKEKFIYKGLSGSAVHITYIRKDATRPAFYQELTYDLGNTDIIVFRNYRIKVLDATNEYIRFIVIRD